MWKAGRAIYSRRDITQADPGQDRHAVPLHLTVYGVFVTAAEELLPQQVGECGVG